MRLDLFGNPLPEERIIQNCSKRPKGKKSHYRAHIASICYPEILDGLEKVGPYNMPVIQGNNLLPNTTSTVAFDKINDKLNNKGSIVVFYINDDRFASRLSHPWDYTEKLCSYNAVVGPDLSQYIDMEYPTRMSNCFWNKAFTAYWQKRGVNIYPNVTWSLPDSYEYSAAGLPKHSIIAINSMGVHKYHVSIGLWLMGYRYMLKTLEPSYILRYGPYVEGEDESISVYLSSTLNNFTAYGSKRK